MDLIHKYRAVSQLRYCSFRYTKKSAVFRLFDAVDTGEYALASLIATAIIVIVLAVEALAYLLTWKVGKKHVS